MKREWPAEEQSPRGRQLCRAQHRRAAMTPNSVKLRSRPVKILFPSLTLFINERRVAARSGTTRNWVAGRVSPAARDAFQQPLRYGASCILPGLRSRFVSLKCKHAVSDALSLARVRLVISILYYEPLTGGCAGYWILNNLKCKLYLDRSGCGL